MNRFNTLAHLATRCRPLVRLALLAGGLLALAAGIGAPVCGEAEAGC